MLSITIPSVEMWDEERQEFISREERTLHLEHSLVSLAKWEAKWNKSFLANAEKLTGEETLYYIKCMTITKNVPDEVYSALTQKNLEEIKEYIGAPMTATTVNDIQKRGGNSGELVTAELIYYWMIALTIPFECEKWHLNRLIMLIKVCEAKNQPAKKMSQRDIMRQNSSVNAARRKRLHSKG